MYLKVKGRNIDKFECLAYKSNGYSHNFGNSLEGHPPSTVTVHTANTANVSSSIQTHTTAPAITEDTAPTVPRAPTTSAVTSSTATSIAAPPTTVAPPTRTNGSSIFPTPP